MASPNLVDLIIAWIAKHQTILVAVYGAVVATAVAAWNILREITNRGRLRVMVNRADVMATGVGQIGKDKVWFKVTNIGRESYLTGPLFRQILGRIERLAWHPT